MNNPNEGSAKSSAFVVKVDPRFTPEVVHAFGQPTNRRFAKIVAEPGTLIQHELLSYTVNAAADEYGLRVMSARMAARMAEAHLNLGRADWWNEDKCYQTRLDASTTVALSKVYAGSSSNTEGTLLEKINRYADVANYMMMQLMRLLEREGQDALAGQLEREFQQSKGTGAITPLGRDDGQHDASGNLR